MKDILNPGSAGSRLVYLNATPQTGTSVSSIDLDVTVDCNMRCVYCFKEKRHEQMSEQVAFDAILGLIYGNDSRKESGTPRFQYFNDNNTSLAG